jgi:hypothetical protein
LSGCNMLEKAEHVQLQHAQTGGNMSRCNMLEKADTCLATTCSNRRQHVLLQHAQTGCNIMLNYN